MKTQKEIDRERIAAQTKKFLRSNKIESIPAGKSGIEHRLSKTARVKLNLKDEIED